MPAVLTYSSLITSLKNYSERYNDTSMNDQLPLIVTMAEYRISQEVKVLPALNYVTDTLQAGVSIYPKPGRQRDTEYINISTGVAGFETTAPFNRRVNLLRRAYDFCREFSPDPTATGVPQFYSDYGMAQWLIVPTPNAAYPIEVAYYERAEPLSDSNQTNWITQYAPNLLLYACMLELAPFLKNFEAKAQWQELYNRAALALSNEDVLQGSDAQSSSTQGGN